MIIISWLEGELPPKPDSRTGEPRPPRAPNRVVRPQEKRSAQWARYPAAPDGRGPVLEWFQSVVWKDSLGMALGLGGLAAAGFTLHLGWRWITVPRWPLIVFVIGSLGAAMAVADSMLPKGSLLNIRHSAGAGWLATPWAWVDTYELVEIDAVGPPLPDLVLVDRSGREVRYNLVDLQTNAALWDLIYNGIRHSVRNGAHISERANDELQKDQDTF